MGDTLILLVGLAGAGAFVLSPLLGTRRENGPRDEDRDAAAMRHRVSLEALRDVESDRLAGSLDAAAYADQLAQAEERAALTRAALDRHSDDEPVTRRGGGRRPAIVAGGLIGLVLVGGSLVPATGIGNTTGINQALADARAAESARQDRIADLLAAFAARPQDTVTISALADEYLAGSTIDDLVRSAGFLQLLIALEPERADAYERIMSAYLRAGDAADARAAHASYATLDTADPIEVALFDGLIALRGEDDPERARQAFELFLELAPNDPRAAMVRGLLDEVSGSGG